MKIGLFTDFYLPHTGGVETAVMNTAAALRAAGHEVTIVCPENPAQKTPVPGELRLARYRNVIPNEHPVVLPSRKNRHTLMTVDFDVVHAHTEHGAGMLAAWYAIQKDVPFFETVHTHNIAWVNYNYGPVTSRFTSQFINTWTRGWTRRLGITLRPKLRFSKKEPRYERLLWHQMTLLLPYANKVFIPSSHLLKETKAHYPTASYQLLPNAVDTSRFKPQYDADEPVRILWVARAWAEKRPLEFLQAIMELQKLTDTPFRVDMVGFGRLLSKMKDFVKKHKLENVRLHGSVPPEKVRGYYAKADIFAITSVGFDNQPVVLAEAMASGLRTLLCDPNLADQVADEARCLTDPSPKAMAKGLKSILQKKTEASAQPICDFAETTYSLPVLAKRLEKAYQAART